MRQLWHDVKRHRLSAACFLVGWLAVWIAYWYLDWSGGIPNIGVVLGLLAPPIAGSLVGWWRAPARESLLIGGRYPAGAPLAATIVIVADMALLFAPAFLRALQEGPGESVGVLGAFLGASMIMGLIALLLGWLGGLAGWLLASALRAPAAR
jgi:hypothetical protein